MKLLIDVGNSRVKWGLLDQPWQWRARGTVTTEAILVKGKGLDIPEHLKPEAIAIASVGGAAKERELQGWCEEHFCLTPWFARSEPAFGAIQNAYRKTGALGVDRWLAMIACRDAIESGFCVVDCGSAITLDVVAAGGQHLGGHILPGLKLMHSSLLGETGQIADSWQMDDRPDEGTLLGTNTRQAVELGALSAAIGYLEAILRQLRQHYAVGRFFITGGDGPRLQSLITSVPGLELELDPDLVLKGLFAAHEASLAG